MGCFTFKMTQSRYSQKEASESLHCSVSESLPVTTTLFLESVQNKIIWYNNIGGVSICFLACIYFLNNLTFLTVKYETQSLESNQIQNFTTIFGFICYKNCLEN